MGSKNLLRKFFKKEAENFKDALENPERTTMIKAEFEQRKGKVLADIKKKCFKKQNSK